MKIYKLSQSNIVFDNQFLESYSGQKNFRLNAQVGDEIVGWIDHSIYDDDIHVSNIEVLSEHKRKGIGTKLLMELQRLFPDKAFEMGMFTEEGHKLWESLPKKVVVNEEYEKLVKEKMELEQRSNEIVDKIDNMPSAEMQTPSQHTELINFGEQLDFISDRLYEIDEELYDMKSEYVYVDFEK